MVVVAPITVTVVHHLNNHILFDIARQARKRPALERSAFFHKAPHLFRLNETEKSESKEHSLRKVRREREKLLVLGR